MTTQPVTVALLATLAIACNAPRSKHDAVPRDAPSVTFRQLRTDAAASKPNIILVIADDLGYGDLGSFWQDKGSHAAKKFDTPNLDRLAAEGMKLTHHYVGAPVCAPSRGSLLTGRHQGHSPIRSADFDVPLPNNHTLGTVMRAGGYTTAWIGKGGLCGYRGVGEPGRQRFPGARRPSLESRIRPVLWLPLSRGRQGPLPAKRNDRPHLVHL